MEPLVSSSMHVFFLWVLLLLSGNTLSDCERIFIIINDCNETIWPAITPGESFDRGGYALPANESRVHIAPVGWSGRIWGRTKCNFDAKGNGTCQTGQCGSSLQCSTTGRTPLTLAEFTRTTLNFYDVNLVDGFNLPMSIRPIHTKGKCGVAGCVGDLRKNCPSELSVKVGGKVVACRSACDVFNTDKYCCRGVYGNNVTCQPTYYSKKFREVCPTSYTYAYDDSTTIFSCYGGDYIVTFCESRNRTHCTYQDNKLKCSGSTFGLVKNWKSSLMVALFTIVAINNFKRNQMAQDTNDYSKSKKRTNGFKNIVL